MITHPSATLAHFAAGLEFDSIPAEVVQKAKECILDTLGCILEGAKSEDLGKVQRALLQLGDGTTPVMGTKIHTSLQNSVMMHAMMAHSTEYDDSHKQSKTHPGSVVIPAIIGAANLIDKVDGKRFISSVIAGYEILLRIGMGLGAGDHRLRGWHATATCGIFGAAAAAAHLMRLEEEQVLSSLGSAGTQAAGIWAFTSDGSMSKPLHAGKAAYGGLLSAVLAEQHFTGSKYILEAKDGGFFHAYAPNRGDEWKELVTDGLGERFEILNMAYKPYPCCRTTHCAIDAALQLQEENHLPVESIRSVTVRTYDVAKKQCGFSNPANPRLAAFSFAYVVAVALRKKQPITSADFSEALLHDEELMKLHDKVSVECSEELDGLFPKLWPCEVIVETYAGATYSKRVDIANGDPLRPMNQTEREAKFLGCAEGVLSPVQAERILSTVNQLEHLDNIHSLFQLCQLTHVNTI